MPQPRRASRGGSTSSAPSNSFIVCAGSPTSTFDLDLAVEIAAGAVAPELLERRSLSRGTRNYPLLLGVDIEEYLFLKCEITLGSVLWRTIAASWGRPEIIPSSRPPSL